MGKLYALQYCARLSEVAHYGVLRCRNANWIVLGALCALIIGFCTSVAASCVRHRRHKAERLYSRTA